MGEETVGCARTHAHNVRQERLRRKLHRELGPVVLEALADERTIEVMVNPDGRVWWDRLGDGQLLLPDEFSPERAESLVGTVAALLDTVANQDHPHPRARLHEAIEAFENSELARKAFGEAVLEHYLHFARTQQDAFEAPVTDFERKRYFERM
jgi:Flp pilus assembly CpaF family ATPase